MARQMKDSGVEWIGEIPEEWEVCRIKDYFLVKNGATPNSGNGDYWNGDILWITPSDYKTYDVYIDNSSRTITQEGYDSCGTNMVPIDSIIISNRAPIGSVGIAKVPLCTSQGCKSLVKKMEIESKFVYYYLSISGSELNILGRGTTFLELSSYDLSMFNIMIPNVNEQQKISVFLDKKVGEIDSVIEKTEETIEEYKKYKRAIITDAVTKGLNPDAEMKESNIDWIGKIPKHWAVSKIKYELECKDRLREPISADLRERKNPQYDYYGASGIIDKIDNHNVDDTVLLIGEDGANLVMRNLPLVYKATGKFWVNNHAHILKPYSNNDYDYMAYLLEAGDYTNYITGSAQPKLSQSNLMGFFILRIPLIEQKEIAFYLDKKCSEIDKLIVKKEELLADLESYKKSLIYEYVTGKKEIE